MQTKNKIFPLDKDRAMPLILTGAIVLVDQITKIIIAGFFKIFDGFPRTYWGDPPIADLFGNGFFQIIHVRNKAIAFSLGSGISETLRPILFIVLPLLVLGFLFWYYLKSTDFTKLQRWVMAGILGGGFGNIIDRIFRTDGVVDFISVKFFGIVNSPIAILRWDRWPTFNIADSSVVVCCIILFLSILIPSKKSKA